MMKKVHHEMECLVGLMGELPVEQSTPLIRQALRVIDSIDQINTACQTAISEACGKITANLNAMRLDMKYVIFDLEATRRERDELRKQLDNAST